MGRLVTLNAGLKNIALPNGIRYGGGAQVLLSDEEYSLLSATFKTSFLSGDVPSPGTLVQQATTGINGFALINGTANILSWTAPNDGQLHRVSVMGSMDVTVAQTGGNVQIVFTLPDSTSVTWGWWTGGAATGFNFSQGFHGIVVKPGTVVTLAQTSAQTAGAATLWAEIWGS